MKKRLLSALLALALVFVLLPTTALAGETTGKEDYDISINGKGWKFERDNTSGAYIPVYYYHTGVFDDANNQNRTNDNLELTKEGNTVTITIRRGTSHDYRVYPIEFTLKKESTNTSHDQMPCIEMGNSNNLVITGNGTLNIIRNEKDGTGAAVSSSVGDITITGGIVVSVTFRNQKNRNVSGNAISVDGHNLIISGQGTTVTAENSSRGTITPAGYATVSVGAGEIKVSDGATLEATNKYTNPDPNPDFSKWIAYSCAIHGKSLTVEGEKSCVIAKVIDSKYGKPLDVKAYNITGAKIEVGANSPAQTITDINDIGDNKYVKISIPALERDSDVRIANENAVVGVETSIPSANGSGTYFYNQVSKTLTLKDVNITSVTKGNNAIEFTAAGTYTVNLEGTNEMSGVGKGILAANVAEDAINVILSGSGSLDITAKGRAIEVSNGNLTFNNTGAINLTTSNTGKTHNVLSVSGNITIADMEKYSVTGTVQDNTNDGGDIVTLGEASHLKGYQDPDGTAICLKTISIAPEPSKTYYNNIAMQYGETKTAGNGTISCDENGVITLNGATEGTLEFGSSSDSTLVLEGTNTLSSIVTTQKGLTISGSGSLTVGSIRVPNNTTTSNSPSLTIDGAKVIAGTTNSTTRAVEVKGDLTVKNKATLIANSKTNNLPTVQVDGDASFTGSAVTITNNSTELHQNATDATKGDSVSSALYVKGDINITNNANVTAKVENGGGNAIRAVGDITVNGSTVTAVNKGQKFTTIRAKNVYVSGNSKIEANNLNKNPVHEGSFLTYPAIEGNIVNKNTDYSLKFEGGHNRSPEPKTTLAPGEQTTLSYYNVTITRGSAYTAPTKSLVFIGGNTQLLNDTYYTINGNEVVESSESNYNVHYNSTNQTLTLKDATISVGTNKAISVNDTNITINLIGNNTLAGTSSLDGFSGTNHIIEISNGSLTFIGDGKLAIIAGDGTPIQASEGLTINADVTIRNAKNGSFTSSFRGDVHGSNAFAIGDGYTAYATTDGTTWAVYDNTTASENENYTTLRITQEPLAPTTTTITEITVTGLTPPVKGATPVDKSSVTLTEGMTVASITWGPDLTSDGKFAANTAYTAHIKYSVNAGYELAANANCPQVAGANVTRWHQEGMPQDEIEVTFPKTAADSTHQHTYGGQSDWTFDTEKHWKQCTDAYCPDEDGRIIQESEHVYAEGNDICTVCGYNRACEHDWTTKWTVKTVDNNYHWHVCNICNAIKDKQAHVYKCQKSNNSEHHALVCECGLSGGFENHEFDANGVCVGCGYTKSGEIEPPTPDNPGTIVIIRPAEEEKPAQQPNPSTGANDLVGMAVAAAVVAVLGSAALLRKHD